MSSHPLPKNDYFDMITRGNMTWGNYEDYLRMGLEKVGLAGVHEQIVTGVRQPPSESKIDELNIVQIGDNIAVRTKRRSSSRKSSSRKSSSPKGLTRKQRKALEAKQARDDMAKRTRAYEEWLVAHPRSTRSEYNRAFPLRSKSQLKQRRKEATGGR